MVCTEKIYVNTKSDLDIVDITGQVSEALRKSEVSDGIVTVFVPGSTASISTIEYEPNLIRDMEKAFEKIAPSGASYAHHQTWGDDNGKSHVRATMMQPGLTVPFKDKRLLLGTWQQLILLDFDTRPRRREIILQIIGE